MVYTHPYVMYQIAKDKNAQDIRRAAEGRRTGSGGRGRPPRRDAARRRRPVGARIGWPWRRLAA